MLCHLFECRSHCSIHCRTRHHTFGSICPLPEHWHSFGQLIQLALVLTAREGLLHVTHDRSKKRRGSNHISPSLLTDVFDDGCFIADPATIEQLRQHIGHALRLLRPQVSSSSRPVLEVR